MGFGKCDQVKNPSPYGVLIAALDDIVQYILTLPADEMEVRERKQGGSWDELRLMCF